MAIYTNKQEQLQPLFEAAGCICEFESKILLLKRISSKSYPLHWGIPTGKMEDGEKPAQAAIRELYEETGTLLSSHNLKFLETFHVVNDDVNFIYHVYLYQPKIEPKIEISAEHTDFRWVTLPEAFTLTLVPDLESCLVELEAQFLHWPKQTELFDKLASGIQITPTADLEVDVVKEFRVKSMNEKVEPPQKWYAAFGPSGVGKTTLFKKLAQEMSMPFVEDRILRRYKGRMTGYLQRAFLEDETRFFFHFQMEVLMKRFNQTVSAPNNALVDESIFSTLAYSKALYHLNLLSTEEYQTFYAAFRSVSQVLTPPALIAAFDVDVSTLRKRIVRRGRQIEQSTHDERYLSALAISFREVARELDASGFNVKYYNTRDENVDHIRESLKEELS